jgi:hypothetical protein
MGAATADVDFAGNRSCVPGSSCELAVEHVSPILRQWLSLLFADGDAHYEGIFVHLLRYAQLDQSGKMATIIIPNQLHFQQQDTTCPCCYATLNTFIRLLCALGILHKIPRRKDRPTAYNLSLSEFTIPPDAFKALDNLIDPVQTKNKKVRNLAKHVKSRLNQLRVDQQESKMHCDQVNSDLRATLDTVQTLISLLEELDAEVRQRIVNELDRARNQLRVLSGVTAGRFLMPAGFGNTFSQPLQKAEYGQPVDSGTQVVDFVSDAEGKQRGDSAMLQTQLVDSCGQESTIRLALPTCRSEQKAQNLPFRLSQVAHTVEFGDRNLLVNDPVVDSSSIIDNDREISSKRNLQENQAIVIDNTAPESAIRESKVLYRPMDARSAQVLAKFVEGNPGNYRSYIALTRKYHPQIIRAAIINMLAHTYFPDSDGDLPAEIDGELTGKVGRPRKPGAWVTTCCQAYAQYGIPPVMQVLLQAYNGSYNEIRQCMESLSRTLSPKQYWMQWQESLLRHAGKPPVSQSSSLIENSEIGDSIALHEEIPGDEVRVLVNQINREGRSYGITAHPCLQDGHWEVEIELYYQGRISTHCFHSKPQWEQYLSAIQRLPQST